MNQNQQQITLRTKDTITRSVERSEIVDQDTSKRIDRGYLGLQLHPGDSMKLQYRNLRVKQLTD